jgi:tetratricopeptide (TPR) repeat protein
MLLYLALLVCAPAAATNGPGRGPEGVTDADALRAYLALQEQVRSTQQALEKNRQETEALLARSAADVSAQIKTLTQSLNDQRTRELEAVQGTNRLLLIVVGAFALLGFLAMLMTSWLQMRALNRLADFSLNPSNRQAVSGLIPGGSLISNAAAAQANTQLFGALDRIERHMQELERHTAVPQVAPSGAVPAPTAPATTTTPAATPPRPEMSGSEHGSANGHESHNGHAAASPVATDKVAVLLAEGQSLLSLDQPAAALECFEKVLTQDPAHAEALVKKGAALESLHRLEEALECYNHAIAADESLTIAYLQKGGLYNRLERYEEALACYERALQTQDHSARVKV